jgi:Spy/CpxP family protein refolding chaperone
MSTAHRSRRRIVLALPAAVLAAAFFGASANAAIPATTAAPSPTVAPAPISAGTQGIIMRDGGICDPIRHMGC